MTIRPSRDNQNRYPRAIIPIGINRKKANPIGENLHKIQFKNNEKHFVCISSPRVNVGKVLYLFLCAPV